MSHTSCAMGRATSVCVHVPPPLVPLHRCVQPLGAGRSSSAGPSSFLLSGQAAGTTTIGTIDSLATIFDSSDDLDDLAEEKGSDGMGAGILWHHNNIERDADDGPRGMDRRNDAQQVGSPLCDQCGGMKGELCDAVHDGEPTLSSSLYPLCSPPCPRLSIPCAAPPVLVYLLPDPCCPHLSAACPLCSSPASSPRGSRGRGFGRRRPRLCWLGR